MLHVLPLLPHTFGFPKVAALVQPRVAQVFADFSTTVVVGGGTGAGGGGGGGTGAGGAGFGFVALEYMLTAIEPAALTDPTSMSIMRATVDVPTLMTIDIPGRHPPSSQDVVPGVQSARTDFPTTPV